MKKLLLIFALLLWLPLAHANQAELDRAFEAYKAGDYQTALTIIKPLAEQGNAQAQNDLGYMYYNGRGVLKNYDEALKWYSKSAEQGNANAQNNLSYMYYTGEGILKNYTKAYIWASIAIVNGNKTAKKGMQILEEKMDSESIIEAQRLAKQCRESKYKNCGDDNLLNKKAESDSIFKKIFKSLFLYLMHEFSFLLYGGIIFLVVASLVAIYNLFRASLTAISNFFRASLIAISNFFRASLIAIFKFFIKKNE